MINKNGRIGLSRRKATPSVLRGREQQWQQPKMRGAEQESQALVCVLRNPLREIKDLNKALLLISLIHPQYGWNIQEQEFAFQPLNK